MLINGILPFYVFMVKKIFDPFEGIKDITFIFEKLNDFSDDPNKTDILERLRIALSRQISTSIANKNNETYFHSANPYPCPPGVVQPSGQNRLPE